MKLLKATLKLVSFPPLHTCWGKWPVKLFSARCRITKEERFPISSGTEPDNLFFNRFTAISFKVPILLHGDFS